MEKRWSGAVACVYGGGGGGGGGNQTKRRIARKGKNLPKPRSTVADVGARENVGFHYSFMGWTCTNAGRQVVLDFAVTPKVHV